MPKGRGIVRTLLVIFSCCGVLCSLQCAEKPRRKVERPLDAARLIADRINDTQTQAQALEFCSWTGWTQVRSLLSELSCLTF